jgi:putative aldouronate transport system permease protein
MKENSLGSRLFDIFNISFLGIFAILMLFPFWNVIMTSMVTAKEYNSFIFFPKSLTLDAYKFIFMTPKIPQAFLMSIEITVIGTIYDLLLISTTAYALSKKDLPGRNGFTFFYLVVMYFSGGLIPYYIICTKFLHIQSFPVLACSITSQVSVFWVIVLKTFFKEIPESLAESARIDGANEFTILFKIILPLSMPALATITLFQSVAYWNEWFRPLLFIQTEERLPLQLLLRRMILDQKNAGGTMETMIAAAKQYGIKGVFHEAIKMATLVCATLPIIFVYPFLQKYFTKGVMIGSIKA